MQCQEWGSSGTELAPLHVTFGTGLVTCSWPGKVASSAEHPWLCPQFIRLAQTLKYYGYLKFDPCVTDFPEKGCHVVVSAGNNELNFQVRLPNEQIKEGSFKVTRMRCWRVTSSVSEGSAGAGETWLCQAGLVPLPGKGAGSDARFWPSRPGEGLNHALGLRGSFV